MELPIPSEIMDGAMPSSVPLAAGIPPSSSEERETIPAGYHLQDVSRDGNCGVWVLLQAMLHLGRDFLPDLEPMQKMEILRRDVGVIIPDTDSLARSRISTHAISSGDQSHWINTEDFQYFARYLRQPIAIIVRNPNGEITYRHFLETGGITDPASIYDESVFWALISANPDTFILYYSHNHYQAVVKDTQSDEGPK